MSIVWKHINSALTALAIGLISMEKTHVSKIAEVDKEQAFWSSHTTQPWISIFQWKQIAISIQNILKCLFSRTYLPFQLNVCCQKFHFGNSRPEEKLSTENHTISAPLSLTPNSIGISEWIQSLGGHDCFLLSRELTADDSSVGRDSCVFDARGKERVKVH